MTLIIISPAVKSLFNFLFVPISYSGKAYAFTFDDLYGGLMLSHKYSLPVKDYPGTSLRLKMGRCKSEQLASLYG